MNIRLALRAGFAGLLLAGPALSAAVLTVDNNPGAVAMYSDATAAYTAAQNGDTLLFAGSDNSYFINVTVNKSLILQGPGYRLAENNIAGISTKTATIQNLSVGQSPVVSSPVGLLVRGLSLSNASVFSNPFIPTTFEKCSISNVTAGSRVVVKKCEVTGGLSLQDGSGGSLVSNSIIGGLSINTGNVSVIQCVVVSSFGGSNSQTSSISNSIFAFTGSANFTFLGSVTNCLSVGSYLPAGSGNINGATNVFVGVGSNDAKWKLSVNSPAKGAGIDGVDLGAFGGPDPYVLSGLPGLPRITRLSVPAVATSGVGFTFEVEAQSFSE